MKITQNGIQIKPFKEVVKFLENKLKPKFGSDFHLKPEGAIDNLALVTALLYMDAQKDILNLAKAFDPLTATETAQDALYSRIGMIRNPATKSHFNAKVCGTPNQTYKANSITIKLEKLELQFNNFADFTTDENGEAEVVFQCIIYGYFPITEKYSLKIVDAPKEISVTSCENWKIYQGQEQESDNAFRSRFLAHNSQPKQGTRDSNITKLLPYVTNPKYFRIIDCKTDPSIPSGTLKIIAKHNTTDELFARAISDTVAFGVEFEGNTTIDVIVLDDNIHRVSFYNADEIKICIKAELKLASGHYKNSTTQAVKNNIIEYVNKNIYGLGAEIFANTFTIPIMDIDGIENILSLKIKKLSDSEYTNQTKLEITEFPSFEIENVEISFN